MRSSAPWTRILANARRAGCHREAICVKPAQEGFMNLSRGRKVLPISVPAIFSTIRRPPVLLSECASFTPLGETFIITTSTAGVRDPRAQWRESLIVVASTYS